MDCCCNGSTRRKLFVTDISRTIHISRCNVSFENIFREKVEVISSNRQGQPNYNYFSFFVCRNPVLVISMSWSSGILSPLPGVKVGFNLWVQLETVSPGKIETWVEKWKKVQQGRAQPGISNESPPSFPQYLALLASGTSASINWINNISQLWTLDRYLDIDGLNSQY